MFSARAHTITKIKPANMYIELLKGSNCNDK
jgi:hypothetical protein